MERWLAAPLFAVNQRRFLLILAILAALPLLVLRLDSWPSTWFDEGAFSSGAKNIALYGEYAVRSGGIFHRFDLVLSGAGPTVLLPVAIVLRLFGVGLWQARLVVVLYALVSLVLLYLVTNSLTGPRTAIVAVLLLLAAPWTGFLELGRQVMGEVPSLAFILAGLYVWWKATDSPGLALSIVSGAAFGLAIVTKPQSMFLVLALLLAGLADIFYYRSLKPRYWLLPCLVAVGVWGAWYGVQWAVLGTGPFLEQLRLTGAATGSRGLAISIQAIVDNVRAGLGWDFILWGLPALAYQALVCLRRDRSGAREFFLLSIISIWLLWFLSFSLGWNRYAFIPKALTCILIARVFHHATNGFTFFAPAPNESAVPGLPGRASRIALALIPALLIANGLRTQAGVLLSASEQPAQVLARYLDAWVDKSVVIETWEWEMAFLTDHSYHLPPVTELEMAVKRQYFNAPDTPDASYLEHVRPAYLIDGPFSKRTHFYPVSFIREKCELVQTVGDYDLYLVHTNP